MQCCEVFCCCFCLFCVKGAWDHLSLFDALFSYVFNPSSSWYLLPSTGMSVYLRLYSSFVINYFKGTACVCAVCCCFCNLLSHRKKLPFIKVLSHRVSEVPLYSWTFIIFFFPSQLNFLFLFTPATEVWVEIMENTLLSLLTRWVFIRSSSSNFWGCLTYSECLWVTEKV